jgi:formyl-CoA transferase
MLMLAAPSQRLWEGVVQALGAPELASDERFASVKQRSTHAKALEQEINRRLAQDDVDIWLAHFARVGVPVTRVSGLELAVTSPIAAERGTFMDCDQVPLVRLPWRIEGQPLPWVRPAPRLGEHSQEILAELGFDAERRTALLAAGVVFSG